MAAVTAPSGRSLLGKIAGLAGQRAAGKRRTSRVAAFIGEHALTMVALGFADTGMWHLGPVAGWIATAVSVLVADFKLQG